MSLHGGSISAQSDGVGQGSAFTMRLPVARLLEQPESDRQAPAEARSLAPAPEAVSQRILVVDDNVDAANTLSYALESMGHQVRVAYDGPSALQLAAEHVPALALLDIGLPVMDGYELAHRLRTQSGRTRIRLVAVTGYGQTSDRERAFAAGFDAHVVKPLQPELLESILDDLAAERERVAEPPRSD